METAFYGRFLEGAVHPLDLNVGPGMLGLGKPMFDLVLCADAVEGVSSIAGRWALAIAGQTRRSGYRCR